MSLFLRQAVWGSIPAAPAAALIANIAAAIVAPNIHLHKHGVSMFCADAIPCLIPFMYSPVLGVLVTHRPSFVRSLHMQWCASTLPSSCALPGWCNRETTCCLPATLPTRLYNWAKCTGEHCLPTTPPAKLDSWAKRTNEQVHCGLEQLTCWG